MADEKETKVIQIISTKGPQLQMDIAKGLGVEGFIAGAILSTLTGRGELKTSHRKIGASPIYYVSGQEQIVKNRLYPELNELEKRALERLKEMKVAFKDDLYPQERVLLSELKDFVDYLQVKQGDDEVLCWKHNSVSDDEFESILNSKFNATAAAPLETAEPSIVVERGEIILGEEADEKPKISEEKTEALKEIAEEKIDNEKDKSIVAPEEKELKKSEEPKLKSERKRVVSKEPKGAFEKKVLEHAKELGLKIIEKVSVRGDPEYIVSTELPFGEQRYILKAKNKSLNENDISRFYVECSAKKMPGIFLTTKQLSKKVKTYFEKHFGSLIRIIVL